MLTINEMLVAAAGAIDLSTTNYGRASSAYLTVGEWLSVPGTLLADAAPQLFAQGSIPLSTANNPMGEVEFDVDAVVSLALAPGVDSARAKTAVAERIRQHGTYRDRVEVLTRCVRVHFENGFHLDAIPARRRFEELEIPSDRAGLWERTDPKGYTKWFETRCTTAVSAKLRANLEPLPDQPTGQKPPLKMAVQLWKRARDIFFCGEDFIPASMLLTTLTAYPYRGDSALLQILEAGTEAAMVMLNTGGMPVAENPTNPGENLARALADTGNRERFEAFIHWTEARLQGLQAATDLPARKDALELLFGAGPAVAAVQSTADAVNSARGSGCLKYSTGAGLNILTGLASQTHAFHGDDDTPRQPHSR